MRNNLKYNSYDRSCVGIIPIMQEAENKIKTGSMQSSLTDVSNPVEAKLENQKFITA